MAEHILTVVDKNFNQMIVHQNIQLCRTIDHRSRTYSSQFVTSFKSRSPVAKDLSFDAADNISANI